MKCHFIPSPDLSTTRRRKWVIGSRKAIIAFWLAYPIYVLIVDYIL